MTTAEAAASARGLLADLPRLHDFGRGPEVGGLDQPIGERLITELGHYQSPRIVETGAGASTLLFCCLEPAGVTSIAPDGTLHQRMLAEAESRGITTARLRFLCEQAELALPRLVAAGEGFDAALIDGCHNWPSVFVDFCYVNVMLPVGGTLFIDDVQLYSVSQLYLLLRQQPEFEQVALDGKLATFRKAHQHWFLPEWDRQPYLRQNTVTLPSR